MSLSMPQELVTDRKSRSDRTGANELDNFHDPGMGLGPIFEATFKKKAKNSD